MNGFRSIYSSKKSMGGVSEREGALDVVILIEGRGLSRGSMGDNIMGVRSMLSRRV